MLVRQGDLEGARKLLASHDVMSDPFSVRLAIEIELQDAINAAAGGQRMYACERLNAAKRALTAGLSTYAGNAHIQALSDRVTELSEAYGCR